MSTASGTRATMWSCRKGRDCTTFYVANIFVDVAVNILLLIVFMLFRFLIVLLVHLLIVNKNALIVQNIC